MIMTFREAQCLLMLYKACPDELIRRKAIDLVPELREIIGTGTFEYVVQPTQRAQRRKLTAYDGPRPLASKFVVCHADDLDEYKRDYALSFDLVRVVEVVAEDA
jgi:hypothetical protein